MDFARKQLEKYGWSDGKGLGKNENGISEALKPKLKRSVTGIGHDPASEFNEHWWTALYDKAAKNVEVKEKNGKTKKIKTNSNDLVISSSTWKINKKPKATDESEYSEYFVRTAVLTNDKGGRKTENVRRDSESDEDDIKKDVFKMTDEELFAACEGRTAHKGARHGLRATGKLARIAEQEEKLLTQLKYQGYSHAKKLKEKINDQTTSEIPEVQKKKKKHKQSKELEVKCDVLSEECNEKAKDKNIGKKEKSRNISEFKTNLEEVICDVEESLDSKPEAVEGKKKKRKKDKTSIEVTCDIDEDNSNKTHFETSEAMETSEVSKRKKKKKDKRRA